MNYLSDITLSTIFLLFPFMIYLFYLAYNKNIEKEENKLVLCFILFSSIYFILNSDLIHYPKISLYMASIAIIIAYLRKCPLEALVLSLFYIFVVYSKYNLSIYFLIMEYSIYYLLYLLKKKSNFNDYIYIVIYYVFEFIFISLLYKTLVNTDIIIMLITLSLAFITVYIIKKGDSILSYHMSYKELVQEKQLRTSLFKITHEIKN